MAIYAKGITKEQRTWLKLYQKITGFEPMFQDELTSKEMSWDDFTKRNIVWFEEWMNEAFSAISCPPNGEE